MSELTQISRSKCFDGWTEFYQHSSEVCGVPMKFSVYVPPQAEKRAVPILYFLSGLTCTEENFMVKSEVQRWASQHGLLVVAPDTSPRGEGVADEEGYDIGQGAGFYVNATQEPWSQHYRMFDYVTEELPSIVKSNFKVMGDRESIFGHSMGGHGALVVALRQPGRYHSVSAFSPICAPTQCPWGKKAFGAYLGSDESAWKSYDANELMKKASDPFPLLIDQGLEDQFLKEQLMPERLEQTAKSVGFPLKFRQHAGYDHSYYFIASFIREHVEHHAEVLNLF